MNKKLLAVLSLLLMTTSCGNWRKGATPTPPPQVVCSERAPAEMAPKEPRSTAPKERWIAYARRWMGVATAEVQKRVEVADCLDRYRREGVIR